MNNRLTIEEKERNEYLITIGKKICCRCKEELNTTEFRKDKYTKDGLYPTCKVCYKKYYTKRKQKTVKQLEREAYFKNFGCYPEEYENKYKPKESESLKSDTSEIIYKCKQCGEDKKGLFFRFNSRYKCRDSICKQCVAVNKRNKNSLDSILNNLKHS